MGLDPLILSKCKECAIGLPHRVGVCLNGKVPTQNSQGLGLSVQCKCINAVLFVVIPMHREIGGRRLLASFAVNTTSCENGPNYLEHVQSTIDVSFGSRGALVLTLISPSGTRSRLLSRRPRDKRSGRFSAWPFMSTHFWGEKAQGVWTLQVENGFSKENSGKGFRLRPDNGV